MVTASRFRKVCHVLGKESGVPLAARIIKGTTQTEAMKRELDLKASIIRNIEKAANIRVLPCGFVVSPEAPHLAVI